MRKRGRPMGPVLIAVLDLLKMKQMTAREVAIELKLSIEASKNACRRLRDAELIYVFKKIEVDGANKRVSVFASDNRGSRHPAMMVANNISGNA